MFQLSRLKAKDVMQVDVATLSPEDSIGTALALFEDKHIGGAPVIDSADRLVGVLTLSDIARTEHMSGDRVRSQRGAFAMVDSSGETDFDDADPDEVVSMMDDYNVEVVGRERVGDWMAREVISVEDDTSLVEACAVMLEKQIHRVFVSKQKQLVGVISSFDIVRCVAHEGRPSRSGARASDDESSAIPAPRRPAKSGRSRGARPKAS